MYFITSHPTPTCQLTKPSAKTRKHACEITVLQHSQRQYITVRFVMLGRSACIRNCAHSANRQLYTYNFLCASYETFSIRNALAHWPHTPRFSVLGINVFSLARCAHDRCDEWGFTNHNYGRMTSRERSQHRKRIGQCRRDADATDAKDE